ncbi:MAG: hypothetical protein R2991_04400 [Thermoanaerobaculia bacterium]
MMIPKDNLDLVGLRPLVPQSEINSLFKVLRDENFDTYKDWKGRYNRTWTR